MDSQQNSLKNFRPLCSYEKVKVTNFLDIAKVTEGLIKEEEIRTTEVNAIADTGATYLCLPPFVIKQLGLLYSYSGKAQTANGDVDRRIFSVADITIKDRTVRMDVMESDEKTPPLIGYLILEALDFVVNPKTQGLMGNPEHGGKWIVDLYLGL